MDVVRALVGVDGLEVQHVADDRVLVHDAGRAQDVARQPRKPFTCGSLFSRGIRQSWNESSEVIEARIENLPWMSSVEKPGVPRSTRKPPISSSSSLAQTTATSAMEPLVIQSLVPFRTYAPSWRRARVFIAPGSEPWSGSVSPKQPTRAPVARRGSHCSFCASEPYAKMGNMTRPDWTDATERRPESPRSSSCMMSPYATWLSPAHP